MRKNNKYEVVRTGYYSDEWLDKETGKTLNTWQMEKVVNKYYNELRKIKDELDSEIWHHEKVAKGNINLKERISKLCAMLQEAKETIKVKDMLIAQLEDQNDGLIQERDSLLCYNPDNTWKRIAESVTDIIKQINDILPDKQTEGISYAKVVNGVQALKDKNDFYRSIERDYNDLSEMLTLVEIKHDAIIKKISDELSDKSKPDKEKIKNIKNIIKELNHGNYRETKNM